MKVGRARGDADERGGADPGGADSGPGDVAGMKGIGDERDVEEKGHCGPGHIESEPRIGADAAGGAIGGRVKLGIAVAVRVEGEEAARGIDEGTEVAVALVAAAAEGHFAGRAGRLAG